MTPKHKTQQEANLHAWRSHWARMNPNETPADYALRVTNDGKVIAALVIIGTILIITGLVLAYRPL